MLDLFHVVPVLDDTVFDWVGEFEDASFGLGFVADIGFFVVHAYYDSFGFGSAYD